MDFRWRPADWFRSRRTQKLAKAREPRRNRSGTFSAITLGASAIAFLLALFGVGPFAVQAVVIDFIPSNARPLAAGDVFPTVSPVQKIVVVIDSPRPGQAPQTSPAPAQSPKPSPSPNRSPRPSPPPDH